MSHLESLTKTKPLQLIYKLYDIVRDVPKDMRLLCICCHATLSVFSQKATKINKKKKKDNFSSSYLPMPVSGRNKSSRTLRKPMSLFCLLFSLEKFCSALCFGSIYIYIYAASQKQETIHRNTFWIQICLSLAKTAKPVGVDKVRSSCVVQKPELSFDRSHGRNFIKTASRDFISLKKMKRRERNGSSFRADLLILFP